MTKLKSFSLSGLSGRIVTDVMVGGELVFVLEGDSAAFCLSQDISVTKRHRKKRKRARILHHDPNPWHTILLIEKWVKVFLFLINIFGKKVDLFSHLFLTLIFGPFDEYPRFCFQVILRD